MLYQRGGMLMLYTETPMHAGSGESKTVDLAIQRHPTTGWPMIQSSGLKGSLREAAPAKNEQDWADRTLAFGRDASDRRGLNLKPEEKTPDGGGAGMLAVGDAGLLAVPVASVAGVFAWVTCYAAIREFLRVRRFLPPRVPASGRDEVAEIDLATWSPPRATDPRRALAPNLNGGNVYLDAQRTRVVLQDLDLSVAPDAEVAAFAKLLSTHALPDDDLLRAKMQTDFLVVHDDIFSNLVAGAIHVVTRIKIDDETGIVGQGPWDEELLPAETVLYAPLMARYLEAGARLEQTILTSADDIIDSYVADQLILAARSFQIGAGSSIGWGVTYPSLIAKPA